jgi:hypothetical protein
MRTPPTLGPKGGNDAGALSEIDAMVYLMNGPQLNACAADRNPKYACYLRDDWAGADAKDPRSCFQRP